MDKRTKQWILAIAAGVALWIGIMFLLNYVDSTKSGQHVPGVGLAAPGMKTKEVRDLLGADQMVERASGHRLVEPTSARKVCVQVLPSFVGGECMYGWQAIIWDRTGAPHRSSIVGEVCMDVVGWPQLVPISFSAICGGRYFDAWRPGMSGFVAGFRVKTDATDRSREALAFPRSGGDPLQLQLLLP